MDYSLLFDNAPITTTLPTLSKENANLHIGDRYIWLKEIKPQEVQQLCEEIRLHHHIPRVAGYALTVYDFNEDWVILKDTEEVSPSVTISLKKSKNIQKTVIVTSEDLEDVDKKISIKAMESVAFHPFEETFTFLKKGKIMVFDFTAALENSDVDDAMNDLLA